jgi:hypothetical protein
MQVRRVLLACAVVGLLQDPTTVQAQYDSNAGSPYNEISSGSTSGRQGIFGNRTMGAGPKSGRGTLGSGNASTSDADISNARFVRGNRQPGSFVGSSAKDMEHRVGAVQDDTNSNYSNLSGGAYASGMSDRYARSRWSSAQGNQAPAAQNAPAIRTTYHVAFSHPQRDAAQLSTSLTRRLARTQGLQTQTPIQVEIRGRTAILRGVAATEHDRLLAEQLIRLEAEIATVKNEIAIENTPAAE